MTKKSKIIFNLSIKDLKELGIIKTKRKSRKKKYIKQLNNDNIKSDSSHMFGQPTFQNVSNLQTENLTQTGAIFISGLLLPIRKIFIITPDISKEIKS